MNPWVSKIHDSFRQWEFWPFWLLYFPVSFYYLWLAVRCRSFFFFTSSNPSIDFGGMLGESKSAIYRLIPPDYLPLYQRIAAGALQSATTYAEQVGYPVIAKPDVGERGRLVEKLHSPEELQAYVARCPVPFLIQECVDYPVELGVFYVRFPGQERGRVTSLVQKDFMHVTGDGRLTVRELLEKNPRACRQVDFDHPRFQKSCPYIPRAGERLCIESIGNHCRGTIFLDRQDEIDAALNEAIHQVASQIRGFYFGRFDLRCQSIDDLRKLKNFKILELNGAGAEPAHIYQPGASLRKAYAAIFWHLNVLAQISRINRRAGTPYWGFVRGLKQIKAIRQYNRLLQGNQ